MKAPEDRISVLIQVLASRPEEAKVTRHDGSPVVFEISVSQEDLNRVSSRQIAIEAILKSMPEFAGKHFALRFSQTQSPAAHG